MVLYFAAISLMVLLLYCYIIIFRQRNAYYRLQRHLELMKKIAMLRREQQQIQQFRRQVITIDVWIDIHLHVRVYNFCINNHAVKPLYHCNHMWPDLQKPSLSAQEMKSNLWLIIKPTLLHYIKIPST